MSPKPLLTLGLILTVCSRLPAQDVVIEPPAPLPYSEERPAFMCFKKIVISPRDSGSYDVEITLQEPLPRSLPEGRGAYYTMNFDFAELHPEKSAPTDGTPNFYSDLIISFTRGSGNSKFDYYDSTLHFRKRDWEFKIFNFKARKDTISFSLRSPLFALHPASRVVFRSNYMKAISPTQGSGMLTHETEPVSPDFSTTNPTAPQG